MSYEKLSSGYKIFLVHLNTLCSRLRIKEWKEAMKAEMDVCEKNKTLDLVELLLGKKLVGCKWVFIMKHKVDGSL